MSGYKIHIPQGGSSEISWAETYRFPILASRRLSGQPLTVMKLDPYQEKYLMVFEPEIITGLSIDWIDPLADISNESSLSLSSPYLRHDSNPRMLRPLGAALWVGIALQFKQNFKDHLRLEVYYSQGIINMIETEIQYTVTGEANQTFTQRSRGSSLGINLSYPIRLYKFKRSHAKD